MNELETARGRLVGSLDPESTVAEVPAGMAAEKQDPASTIATPDFDIEDFRPVDAPAVPRWLEQITGLNSVELEAAWADFGGMNVDRFLAFLCDRGFIGKRLFLRAHAATDIELTGRVNPIEGDSSFDELGYIDEGGVGEIRVARDVRLRRKVALKQLKDATAATPSTTRRFIKEAQITAQLDHPNIVPVYNIENRSTVGGTVAFAMKLIHGRTLDDIIKDAREAHENGELIDDEHSIADRLEYFVKVCEAISYAHAKGVIHRDLKPANIMVGKFGEVYVMDWGVAKLLDRDEEPGPVEAVNIEQRLDQTRVGQVVGTPYYMSPEQARADNEAVAECSDVYALGLILYELCTLKRAVPGETWLEVVMAAGKGKKYPLQHVSPRVKRLPPDLDAIFRRACARKVAQRYPGAAALGEDIKRYLRGEEVVARPDNTPRKMLRWMANHRTITVLIVLGIVAISATATIWSLYSQKQAIEQAKTREERLSAWQFETAEHSANIDRKFLHFEGLVRRLADSAMFWLERSPETPASESIFSMQEFEQPARAPTDYGVSPLYQKAVSIDYPVYKLAPGVAIDTVRPRIQRLAPLRHAYRHLFLDSRADPVPLDVADQRKLLTETGVPLRWAYVGLEEGVMFSYPGKVGYPPEYDPRKRPWYALAEGKDGVHWGNPYIDLQGQGLILPAVMPLNDATGGFYGVVGVEVTFDEIIETFLSRRDAAGVLETFLLDTEGQIVVRSSQFAESYAEGEMHDALELEPYGVPQIRDAIANGRSGVLETDGKLIGYHRIPTLGWYYIEEVDASVLLGQTAGD